VLQGVITKRDNEDYNKSQKSIVSNDLWQVMNNIEEFKGLVDHLKEKNIISNGLASPKKYLTVQTVLQTGKEELNPVFLESSSDEDNDYSNVNSNNNNASSAEEPEINPHFLQQI
jgi:hypothetical protein